MRHKVPGDLDCWLAPPPSTAATIAATSASAGCRPGPQCLALWVPHQHLPPRPSVSGSMAATSALGEGAWRPMGPKPSVASMVLCSLEPTTFFRAMSYCPESDV